MLRVSLQRGLEAPEKSAPGPQDARLTLYTLPNLARAARAERINLYMNGRLYSDGERISAFRPGVNRVSVSTLLTVRPVRTPDRGRSKISDFRDDERLRLSNHGTTAPCRDNQTISGFLPDSRRVSPVGEEGIPTQNNPGTSESLCG